MQVPVPTTSATNPVRARFGANRPARRGIGDVQFRDPLNHTCNINQERQTDGSLNGDGYVAVWRTVAGAFQSAQVVEKRIVDE